MSSEQSRKVLEDIQRAKSKLLKDGAAASLGIGISSYGASTPSSNLTNSYSSSGGVSPASSDVHLSPAMRSAMQVLQQANMTSFGYFVAQDSHFGNSVLPVLPRIDAPVTTSSAIPSPATSPIKTEK